MSRQPALPAWPANNSESGEAVSIGIIFGFVLLIATVVGLGIVSLCYRNHLPFINNTVVTAAPAVVEPAVIAEEGHSDFQEVAAEERLKEALVVEQPDGYAVSVGIQIPSITQCQKSDTEVDVNEAKPDEGDQMEFIGCSADLTASSTNKK